MLTNDLKRRAVGRRTLAGGRRVNFLRGRGRGRGVKARKVKKNNATKTNLYAIDVQWMEYFFFANVL